MAQLYTTQNNLLLTKLMKFYNVNNNLEKILTIINGENKMSLRLIVWFVTNWAKKYYTVYNISENGESRRFKVYTDYKLKLKAYSKKRFDPFCRWERINIPYKGDSYIQTTIGQLNFFRWAIDHLVIEYIILNYENIETDMNDSIQLIRKNYVKSAERKKRQELSLSASRGLNRHVGPVVITFD